MLEFKKMFKLLSFNKEIFEIKTTPCSSVVGGVFYRIFKIVVLTLLAPIYLCLVLSLFFLYLSAFFFKIPTKLISSIRKDNTLPEDKMIYTVTSIVLYCLVAGFELFYILIMFYSAVISFTLDIVTWCICLGRRTNKALELTFAAECEETSSGILHLVIILLALLFMGLLSALLTECYAELFYSLSDGYMDYSFVYMYGYSNAIFYVVAGLVLIYSFAINKNNKKCAKAPEVAETPATVEQPELSDEDSCPRQVKERKPRKNFLFLILAIVSGVLFLGAALITVTSFPMNGAPQTRQEAIQYYKDNNIGEYIEFYNNDGTLLLIDSSYEANVYYDTYYGGIEYQIVYSVRYNTINIYRYDYWSTTLLYYGQVDISGDYVSIDYYSSDAPSYLSNNAIIIVQSLADHLLTAEVSYDNFIANCVVSGVLLIASITFVIIHTKVSKKRPE